MILGMVRMGGSVRPGSTRWRGREIVSVAGEWGGGKGGWSYLGGHTAVEAVGCADRAEEAARHTDGDGGFDNDGGTGAGVSGDGS